MVLFCNHSIYYPTHSHSAHSLCANLVCMRVGMGTLELWPFSICVIWVMMFDWVQMLLYLSASEIANGWQPARHALSSFHRRAYQAPLTPSPPAKLDKTPIRVCTLAFCLCHLHYVQAIALRDALHWRDKELGTNKGEACEIFPKQKVESWKLTPAQLDMAAEHLLYGKVLLCTEKRGEKGRGERGGVYLPSQLERTPHLCSWWR